MVTTHVVASSHSEIVKQIVRHRINDVIPIDVQSSKHDANPDLCNTVKHAGAFILSFCARALTMIFKSTLCLTAFSSLYVQRNKGSKADRFSHCG